MDDRGERCRWCPTRRSDRGRRPPGRPAEHSSPRRVRIVDATLACLARYGTAKTTVDDIAREAGVSRATVYRIFRGGREEILAAVVDTEMARLFSALGVRLGEATDLADALVGGIVEATTRIRDHAALAYLVEHEPETVLGHLAFDESDRLLSTASRFTAPFLARWMSPDRGRKGGRMGHPHRSVLHHQPFGHHRSDRPRPRRPAGQHLRPYRASPPCRAPTRRRPSTSPRSPFDRTARHQTTPVEGGMP